MRLTAQQRRDRDLADAILSYEVTIKFGEGERARYYRTLAKGAAPDIHRDARALGLHLGGDSVTVVRQAQRYVFDRRDGVQEIEREVTLNERLTPAPARETVAPPCSPVAESRTDA